MRVRTLVSLSLAGAVALSALALGLVWRASERGAAAQEAVNAARLVDRETIHLLAVTHAFARDVEPQAAQQWRARQQTIRETIEAAAASSEAAAPPELRDLVRSLPVQFAGLEALMREPVSPLRRQREDVLVRQLSANLQSQADHGHLWAQGLVRERNEATAQFRTVAIGALFTMALLLASVAVLVFRRVLRPLKRLQAAVSAMADGRLDVRTGLAQDDEFGLLSRDFDAMARTLAEQLAARRDSEAALRAVTDNLPALVAHIDASGCYTFANEQYRRVFNVDPSGLVGRTWDTLGDETLREQRRPHIAAALRGEAVRFDGGTVIDGRRFDYHAHYVPDIDRDGRVRGFYALVFDITDRKQAQEELRLRERFIRTVTNNMPVLIFYVDRHQRYRFANDTFRTWYGHAPQVVIGQTMEHVLGAPIYAARRCNIERALSGERQSFEHEAEMAGSLRWQQIDYIPDVDDAGEVVGLFGMATDITDFRVAQLATETSQRRLKALTDQMPALVAHFDIDGRCLYANQRALKMHGIAADDLAQHTLQSALAPETYAQCLPHLPAVRAGQAVQFEGAQQHQGRGLHFQAHLVPDRAADGAVAGFYLMTFDVTALKDAEAARAAREAQLRTVTDNLPVLISYIDRNEHLTFVNRTFQRWLGIDPDAALHRPLREVIGEVHYAARKPHLDRALAGERVDFDVVSSALGLTRELQNSYIPDVDAKGEVAGIYTLSTDVTELKLVHRELDRLAREDTLTGLPNRRQFDELFGSAVARARRTNAPLALAFLDIDRFKSINDSLGHAAGDAVLKEYARRLRAAVRATDAVARLAGDEFVVVLEHAGDEDDVQRLAAKIVDAIASCPVEVAGTSLTVTTSLGAALAPTGSASAAQLLALADEALYDAKERGRNRHAVRVIEGRRR